MPAQQATPKRYRSDRWHRLDQLLKRAGGLDEYVNTRRAAGDSWHAIAASIARDTAQHLDVAPPTVNTLIRWYAQDPQQVPAQVPA
jgi:hypothetical protein